jgi:hypothetical protein
MMIPPRNWLATALALTKRAAIEAQKSAHAQFAHHTVHANLAEQSGVTVQGPNAVFNATASCVRDLPITLDKVT